MIGPLPGRGMGARVAIVGYGMGNVRSLGNALSAVGAEHHLAQAPEDLEQATHIILPGVGAFPLAMQNLQRFGFVPALRRHVLDEGRPFLGVCLGMQLLASTGEEHEETPGLGFIPGRVKRLQPRDLSVPHMGWNDTVPTRDSRLLARAACHYYVHSYHLVPQDPADVTMTCDYGGPVVAGVERGNVMGVQFHPEKSHADGLDILRRFLET